MYALETREVALYGYDEHGVYCGSFGYLWVEGTGLAANSTLIEPIEQKEGFAIVWNGEAWEYQEDHTGKTIYSISDRSSKTIEDIGPIKPGYTLLKPNTQFDTWNGEAWEDQRTPAEIAEYERSLLPRLTKRQFALQLNSIQVSETTMYKQTLALIAQDEIAQIEWDTVSYIERLSPTVISMTAALGLTDEEVDQMWREALSL